MLAWLAVHEFTVIGLIWMVVLGPAVGNYACSVVYRLPRGKTPFERHPYCGHCNADLKPIDLFPIWSWVSTRGKCRYCAGPIPSIYTVIELVCGAVFIAYFLTFGVNEFFLLYAGMAVFTVILASIQWQQGWLSVSIYSYVVMLMTLARSLAEHTIYGVVHGAFIMLVLMLLVHKLSPRRAKAPFETPWIWWMVLLAALVPLVQWPWLAPLLVVAVLPRKAQIILYSAAVLALPVLLTH